MYIAILGRQPAIGIAELERVFGGTNVSVLSNQTVTIKTDCFEIQKLGGSLKAGKIIDELTGNDWPDLSQKAVKYYYDKWSAYEGKITLGISVYNHRVSPREIQKIGLALKRQLKSLRLIPNQESVLNTATSHHNKLGLSPNKVELIIIRAHDGRFVVAESTGAQNITAYAKRDQERPKRDAFVGMLPPKLAQIMINLAVGQTYKSQTTTILDPFCGTGVVLQEALLMGYSTYGTDLSNKMIDYSRQNLEWLSQKYHKDFDFKLYQGDAMTTKWQPPIDAIACETYLGQPFSSPPSPDKLEGVRNNCNHIISEFLKNLASQIKPGTPLCIAVPAWRDSNGHFTHLPLIDNIARLGFKPHEFINVSKNDMLYYRENQVVARELLVLTKI